MIKKIGTPFFLELNSHQKFFSASGFVTKIVNLSDNSISIAQNDATEIVEVIESPATATVDAASATGSKQIVVQSGGSITDGMVFKDANGNKYYVEKVVGDKIHLKFPLTEGIAYGDALVQVGNTGIYKIELTINTLGNFGIYIENSSIDLRSKGIQCTIESIVLEDVNSKIETGFAAVTSQLNDLQANVAKSGTEDFTVFSG